MTRLKLAKNDLGLTEAIGPLVMDNVQPAAEACGGEVVAHGVAFDFRGARVVAPWGTYLITDGIGWGVAAHWWVEAHLA